MHESALLWYFSQKSGFEETLAHDISRKNTARAVHKSFSTVSAESARLVMVGYKP